MSTDIYVDTFYGIMLSYDEAINSVFNLTQKEEDIEGILFSEDEELLKRYQLENLKFTHISYGRDKPEFCISVPESYQSVDVIIDNTTRKFPHTLENIQNSLDEMKKLSSKEPQWHMTIEYS